MREDFFIVLTLNPLTYRHNLSAVKEPVSRQIVNAKYVHFIV